MFAIKWNFSDIKRFLTEQNVYVVLDYNSMFTSENADRNIYVFLRAKQDKIRTHYSWIPQLYVYKRICLHGKLFIEFTM